ncbi:SOS response-associated peptidase [Pseudotabrizicola sediminis]|nr:SOS response-associated peptidase [Pseudotabrizicola sediminis]
MYKWLDRHIGKASYALHGGGGNGGRDRIALYFRCPHDASAFADAFPNLEVADGTILPGYYSPNAPHGNVVTDDEAAMCNLYSQTTAQEAVRRLFVGLEWSDGAGNLEPGSIYPDRLAPIVRHSSNGLELVRARWGMPSPASVLKTERDPGVANVRNLASPHWRRWLGPAHRCLVPVTSFAEPKKGGNQWFGPAEPGKPMFFAGIEVRGWQSLRKVKDGPTTDDLFAFLTCTPNAEVGAVHPKAMPAILTEPDEWETWLSAPFEIAAKLQRPLPDGALQLLDEPI